jgi:hypothetical protein
MALQPPASAAQPFTFSSPAARHANAHFFHPPPKSPASTFTSPALATPAIATSGTDYFSQGSGKRARADGSHGFTGAQSATTPAWPAQQCPTPSDGSYVSTFGGGIVNDRYTLAGGFDTPGLMTTSELEARQLHFGPLGRERNGGARTRADMPTLALMTSAAIPSASNGEPSKLTWTSVAFGLMGKVFNFGSSVFRGFYAGGGKGYEMQMQMQNSGVWSSGKDGGSSTPLPGAWKEGEFLGDFEQDNPASSSPASRPPNKRRQTDRDAWVMVGTPDTDANAPPSPRRKGSSTSVPRSSTLHGRPSAARASSRRGIAPLPRRQSHHQTAAFSTGSPAPASTAVYNTPLRAPQSPVARRASLAPVRPNSRPGSSSGNANMYISPEAEKFLRRRARQEKHAEAAIGDMSRRLADLIKQGQEALGTKVSVEGSLGAESGDMMDEGFVDEEW